jgi:hypothetical protein
MYYGIYIYCETYATTTTLNLNTSCLKAGDSHLCLNLALLLSVKRRTPHIIAKI